MKIQECCVPIYRVSNNQEKKSLYRDKKKSLQPKKCSYLCNRLQEVRAFSSAGLEHLPYKQRVGGSNPSTPTMVKVFQQMLRDLFLCF